MERQTSSVKSNLVKSKKGGGEKMKKILMLVAAVVLFAVPVMAGVNVPGGGIKNSKHNLGSSGFGNGLYADSNTVTSQICVFCHTPHTSDGDRTRPLWVRETRSVTKTYSSITINNAPSTALMVVAKLCLSCHDGSIAPGATASGKGTSTNTLLVGTQMIRSTYNIGGGTGDLGNDHPIGMDYVASKTADEAAGSNAALRTVGAGGPQASWFRTVGAVSNVMDCSTCHELHNSTPNAKFLRVTRDSSGICRTCHNK